MSNVNNTPNSEDLNKGLEVVELEERLEMVHLSAVDAEASWKCDVGGDVVDEAGDVIREA
jgi:hypothetical protein